jgi:hypothetical protein
MAQIFPSWANKMPLFLLGGITIAVLIITGFFWYFGSPKYTDVGYQPNQPVQYSHKLHAGDLGLDCRYCHYGVEISPIAGVPPTQTCMNCHSLVKPDSEKLKLIIESWATRTPIKWIRVHKSPDYVYFDHSAHSNAGIGCVSCHGRVDQMESVFQAEPLSMGWCLDCHRDPTLHLRPQSEITNMKWKVPAEQTILGQQIIADHQITPPTDCTGCHR